MTYRQPGRHLALMGPTTSGKTSVSIEMAVRRTEAGHPTEIVSCDSMQVYRGMDVGTDKPTESDRRGIPHHMIDVVAPTEDHNLPKFIAEADRRIDEIESRDADALLVGGTGLYVRGLVDGFDPPPRYPQVATDLESESTDELTERLRRLDPLALSRIPPRNRRRLVRALEVTIGSGQPFSSFGSGLDSFPGTPFVLTGLWPSREEITDRIAQRYETQLADGMLSEAQILVNLGDQLSRTAGQALGYRELMSHLRGECSLPEALERARIRTRKFAVRQQRWFVRDPRIVWFDPPSTLGTTPTPVADNARDELLEARAEVTVEAVSRQIIDLWHKRGSEHLGSVGSVDQNP